jgi:hypothetical protein
MVAWASLLALVGGSALPATASGDDGARHVGAPPPNTYDWPSRPSSASSSTPAPTHRSSAEPRSAADDCDQPEVLDTRRDGKPFDIVRTELSGDCDTWTLTTTLGRPLAVSRLNYWAMEIDLDGSRRTGCRGTDRLVFGRADGARIRASIYATTDCAANTWTLLGTAPVQRPDPRSLRVSFSGFYLEGAETFEWWVNIDALGDGGFDAVPNAGTIRAWGRPGLLLDLAIERYDPWTMRLTWMPPISTAEVPLRYVMTISKDGGPDTEVERRRPRQREHWLRRLAPGRYTVSIAAANPLLTGPSARLTIIVPETVDA